MSDTISSASQTISSQLTDASSMSSVFGKSDCTMSNIRFLMYFIFVILFICTFLSLVSQVCQDSATLAYQHPRMKRGCQRGHQEDFSNDKFYSYKSTQSANYKSIPLTAPNSKDDAPSNLMFGQANRYISANSDATMFLLEITANMYVLDGNVFANDQKVTHDYKAYLVQGNNRKLLGSLKRDGDGLYKLRVKSDKPADYLDMQQLNIIYEKDNTEQVLLVGHF